MTQHRYREEPIPGLPGQAKEWSPEQPKPHTAQGWLSLDGSALGPLFDTQEEAQQ